MDERKRLLISNVPLNCSEEFLAAWIEARGFRIFKVNLIRDVISGTSPSFAYVQLMDNSKLDEAVRSLSGQSIRNHTLIVSRVAGSPSFERPVELAKRAG